MARRGEGELRENVELREDVEDILNRLSKGDLSVEYATDLILRYARNFYARHPVHKRKRY